MKFLLILVLTLVSSSGFSQSKAFIKVHFLYGSKPHPKFRDAEPKWFGGKLGGHVGIEIDSNQILNFVPRGEFHTFPKNKKNSAYIVSSHSGFYSIFATDDPLVKKVIFCIPISEIQKIRMDSIARLYLSDTPYDYAFFGMRCGAAAYEILAQLKILPRYSFGKTSRRIFYPRRLRKRLFALAIKENWLIIREDGSSHRIWEKD